MKKNYLLALLPSITTIAAPMETPVPPPANPIDYFIDGAFTYWYAKEDGLNIGESALLGPGANIFFPPNSATVLQQSFSYKPGFKVGIGASSCDWKAKAEYTYYRSKTTVSKNAPENTSSLNGIGVWNVDDWFLQSILDHSVTGTHISSTWHLGMDLGDLILSRPFIKKEHLSFSPFGGLRTVWLRQQMNISLIQSAASLGSSVYLPAQPIHSYNSSHAWGIGPRVGAEGRFTLYKGLRLEGLFAASLLYTQFTSVKHSEDKGSTLMDYNVQTLMNHYNCVRPVLDANLGIGWGMCFYENYSIDLSASYDFSYFFGQNMMRTMLDEFWDGVGSGNNDLYFQGITISAGFSF